MCEGSFFAILPLAELLLSHFYTLVHCSRCVSLSSTSTVATVALSFVCRSVIYTLLQLPRVLSDIRLRNLKHNSSSSSLSSPSNYQLQI